MKDKGCLAALENRGPILRKRFEDNPVMVHIAFIRGHAIYKEKLGSRVILKLVSLLLFFHPSIFTFNRPLMQMRSRLLEEFLSNNNLNGFICIAICLKFFLQKEIYLKFFCDNASVKNKVLQIIHKMLV